MRLTSVDLDVKSFGREIERFLSATDRRYWEQLIEKIDATDGIFFKNSHLLKRNPLLEGIKEYRHLCEEGQSIWKHHSPAIDLLARNAFIINRILHSVNDAAKNQILGKLKNDDIRPLLHECSMVVHFLRNGFEVEFAEYEKDETYDFYIRRNSIEAEVECKWKSFDAGRKIKRPAFYTLCDEIMKQLRKYRVKCLIEINCARSLSQNRGIFVSIAEKLKAAFDREEERIDVDQDLSVKINYLPEGLSIKSDQEFRVAIDPFFAPNCHFATLSNNEMTIIIKVESEERDRVLKAIYDELKNSLGQFSKSKPGLIACYIEGIYPEEWEELQGENGLAAMTTRLLNRENAKYIHTIGYSSEVEPVIMGQVTDYKHPVLFFKNENCSFHKDEDIFLLKK